MLQARIFSYADTARYRLGSNYLMLTPNSPINTAGATGYAFDGQMNFKPRANPVCVCVCVCVCVRACMRAREGECACCFVGRMMLQPRGV